MHRQLEHPYTSWTISDPFYSEMSPITKTLGYPPSSNFHYRSNITSLLEYACERCSDHSYAHFVLRCVCGKYTCCSCYFHKARCLCNLPFNCNTIFITTFHYYKVLQHDCKLEKNFQKLEFLDQETLRNVSSDSRNRVELVLPRRWLELLQTPNLNDISCRFRISNIVSISKI